MLTDLKQYAAKIEKAYETAVKEGLYHEPPFGNPLLEAQKHIFVGVDFKTKAKAIDYLIDWLILGRQKMEDFRAKPDCEHAQRIAGYAAIGIVILLSDDDVFPVSYKF